MDASTPRIALLIDADNAPASKIDLVFSRLSYLGTIRVRRAYGNWKKDHLQGWAKILHKHAIVPIQQFDYVTGKNATDIALAIDAMDLLQTMRPEVFGIVAGDSDYTPLVVRLIASGSQVFGFGQVKTASIAFREACTEFISLEGVANKMTPSNRMTPGNGKLNSPSSQANGRADANALTLAETSPATIEMPAAHFIKAVEQNQQATGWADVKSIGAYLSQRKIVKAAYNVNRWASYYKKFPSLFEVRERDGKTMVRLLSDGNADAKRS
ncbi:NYN domain-containing protein [Oscillatoria sp. CS-180]|uniref:NYN domain-containing protein n=1 Tax=Oscillatoria sp. CS-180 TaxID=3021720 RepID=UPI00232C49F5|nr:NYN domain-containing protein [Oscillatoria sp. CS-180]MDB9527615.1 NYN domain-containing protein [Oscillatoria sp. CS-180]